ncbi:unnamed protein product [Caretta caretta]
MPTNKSPGLDGLTVEFYRMFWDVLGPELVTVWAESLQSRVLPLSCRRAVLTLLPKKGDFRDLQNWRPISLLSTDYKIIAKAITLRLGSVLVDVIHPDQTYTVLDHSIFDNLFMVWDLLELGRRDGLSFTLLSLDQEKAFDRVDHRYLLNTLQAFGFGPQFVGFLQVLYTSAECLVKLNWILTEPVSFGLGVRQGCPLSGQLYALAIEPFLCLLRRRLTGLVLQEPELQLVLSAYADDVLLVIQDPGDLARVEACQAIYLAASSAWVNWVKSSGLAVGDWRQASSLPPALQTIRWSAGPLLSFGIYFSATHPSLPENWENLEGRASNPGVIEVKYVFLSLLMRDSDPGCTVYDYSLAVNRRLRQRSSILLVWRVYPARPPCQKLLIKTDRCTIRFRVTRERKITLLRSSAPSSGALSAWSGRLTRETAKKGSNMQSQQKTETALLVEKHWLCAPSKCFTFTS